MTLENNGKTYYGTTEACQKAGISRATLFRWLKTGILSQQCRDRRGWRLFTEDDISTIRAEACKVKVEYASPK